MLTPPDTGDRFLQYLGPPYWQVTAPRATTEPERTNPHFWAGHWHTSAVPNTVAAAIRSPRAAKISIPAVRGECHFPLAFLFLTAIIH